jgi:hypothetical protein
LGEKIKQLFWLAKVCLLISVSSEALPALSNYNIGTNMATVQSALSPLKQLLILGNSVHHISKTNFWPHVCSPEKSSTYAGHRHSTSFHMLMLEEALNYSTSCGQNEQLLNMSPLQSQLFQFPAEIGAQCIYNNIFSICTLMTKKHDILL